MSKTYTPTRNLTQAQSARLEKLGEDEIGTRVVGWYEATTLHIRLTEDGHVSDRDQGPIIRRTHNGTVRDDIAAFRWINRHGHLKPLSRQALNRAGLL